MRHCSRAGILFSLPGMKFPLGLVLSLLGLALFARAETVASHLFELHMVFDTAAPDRIATKMAGQAGEVYIDKAALMNESAFKSAKAEPDSRGSWQIQVELTSAGAKLFSEITGKNIGGRLGFVVDGTVVSAPVIHQQITGPGLVISGSFNKQTATELAAKLNPVAKPK
jgi:preprotein translocase subunit SecD